MFSDFRPPHGQRAPVPVPGEPEGGAPDLRAPPRPCPRSAFRPHLAGPLLPGLQARTALLGVGGVQTLGIPRGKEVPPPSMHATVVVSTEDLESYQFN